MTASADPTRTPSGIRPWLITLAAVAAFIAAMWISAPGIDWSEVRSAFLVGRIPILQRYSHWILARHALGATSVAAVPLVIVRGLLAVFRAIVDRPREAAAGWSGPYRLPPGADDDSPEGRARHTGRFELGAYVIYLALCLWTGMHNIRWIEHLQLGDLVSSAVETPGWGFRIGALATFAIGSTVAWILSRVITHRGVAQGPLAIFAGWVMVERVLRTSEAGAWAGAGVEWPRDTLRAVSEWMPLAITLLVMQWRRPARWPARVVGRLSFGYPADIALTVLTLAALPSEALEMIRPRAHVSWLHGPITTWLPAFAVILWLVFQRPREDEERLSGLVACTVIAAGIAAWIVGVISAAGSVPDFVRQGLLHGGYSYGVAFANDGDTEPHDARALIQRLTAVGLRATESSSDGRRLELRVTSLRPLDRADIDRAMARHELSVHWLAIDQTPLEPRNDDDVNGVEQRIVHGAIVRGGPEAVRRYVSATPDALRPLVAAAAIPPNATAAVHCQDRSGVPSCSAWLIDRTAIFTTADVASAEWDFHDVTGEPYLRLSLRPAGAARFGEATAANIGRLLAFVVDGSIAVRPRVNAAIRNGSAVVAVVEPTPASSVARAKEFAAAFTAPLRGSWRVTAIRAE